MGGAKWEGRGERGEVAGAWGEVEGAKWEGRGGRGVATELSLDS